MSLRLSYDLRFDGSVDDARGRVQQLRLIAARIGFQGVSEIHEYAGDAAAYERYEPNTEQRGELLAAAGYKDGCAPEYAIGFTVTVDLSGARTTFGLAKVDGKRRWRWHETSSNLSPAAMPAYGGVDNFVRAYDRLMAMFDAVADQGLLKHVFDETGYYKKRKAKKLIAILEDDLEGVAGLFGELKDAFPGDGFESHVQQLPDFEVREARARADEPALKPPPPPDPR